MKLGIGLIIIGVIFLWDGITQLFVGMPVDTSYASAMAAGACIKLVIGGALLFFGIRRVKRKGQKEVQE